MPGMRIALTADEANAALTRFRSNLAATGTSAIKTQREVKDLERQMLSMARTEKATKGFQDMSKMLGLTRGEASKLAKQLDLDVGSLGQVEKSTGSLGMAFMKVGFAIAGAAVAIKMFVSPALNYLGKIEGATLGIATSFMMNGKYIDQFTGKALQGTDALAAAQMDAKKMVEELQIANLQTIATLDQLIVAYSQALPVAMSRGFSKEQAKNFTVAMVQAAGAIDPMLLHQLAEETRSLLMGVINPRTTRIATVMGLSSADNKRIIELQKEGKLYDFLMEKLSAYTIAGVESQKTWQGLWSNFRDIVMMTAGKAFEGLFEMIKGWLMDVTDSLITIEEVTDKFGKTVKQIKWSEDLVEGIKDFKAVIDYVVAEVRRLAMFLDKVGGTLTTIMATVSGERHKRGYRSLAEEMGIAESPGEVEPGYWEKKNKMFQDRYNKQDIALLDQAMKANSGLIPVSQKELENMAAPPESYGHVKMYTEEGVARYYRAPTKFEGRDYQQNPQPKDADEKAKGATEKLREEIEKMTHDTLGLIELQAAKYAKEGVDQALVNQWKILKVDEYKVKQATELNNQLLKTDKEKQKMEDEYVMAKEQAAGKILKIETDLQAKLMELSILKGDKTEKIALEEKFDIQQRILDQEIKEQTLKLNIAAAEAGSYEADTKEMRVEEQKLFILVKQKNVLKDMQDIEMQTYKEKLRGAIGYADPNYLTYKKQQIKNISDDMKSMGLPGADQWEIEQNKSILKEYYQYIIDNSSNVWDALKARQDMYKSDSENTTKSWVQFYDNALSTIEDAFLDFFDSTSEGFMDMSNLARNVANDILKEFLRIQVIKPVVEAGGAGLTSLFGGLAGMLGLSGGGNAVANTTDYPTDWSGYVGSAHGNIFRNGRIVPFKRGGIVDKQTYFPIGSMAEGNKAEAIMPLARDASGNLGVMSGSGQESIIVNQFNISAMDAKSFASFAYENKTIFASAGQAAVRDNHPTRRGRR